METKQTSRPAQSAPRVTDAPSEEHLRIIASYAPDSLEGDPELAQIIDFAARLCDAPVAALTRAGAEYDRFLVQQGGAPLQEISRDVAFCPLVIAAGGLVEITDALLDPRLADNPNVHGEPFVRFYAGFPLVTREGVAIGTLSVLDRSPRPAGLTSLQRHGLEVLANAAMLRLRSHRKQLAVEREAERRETQLRVLADSIPAIAWSADAQGRFEYFNQQMVEFTGDPDDEEGKSFHPEDWPKATEAWQHSLRTGETYQIEHRLRRHDGEYRWMMSRAVPVRDEDGTIVRWFGTAVDIHDLYAASEAREIMANELSHRIKNIFAVIAGLISLSARTKPEHKPFADELNETIRALGRAHDFVRATSGTARDSLHGFLAELFAPYGTGDRSRVRISGHDCPVGSRAATPLALVFHELATNSAKYGALASDHGGVELTLTESGDKIHLTWAEHGGKPPTESREPGFGSRLVEMSITGQLGGSWERRFEPTGMVAELTLSTDAVCDCD